MAQPPAAVAAAPRVQAPPPLGPLPTLSSKGPSDYRAWIDMAINKTTGLRLINGLPRLNFMVNSLNGEALAWYNVMRGLQGPQADNDAAFKAHFDGIFLTKETVLEVERRMATLAYSHEKGIDDYLEQFWQQWKLSPHLDSASMCRYFVAGLNNCSSPLVALINVVEQREAEWTYAQLHSAIQANRSLAPIRAPRVAVPQPTETVAAATWRPRPGSGASAESPRLCFACGRPGHLIRDCRNRSAVDRYNRRRGRGGGRRPGGTGRRDVASVFDDLHVNEDPLNFDSFE